VQDALEEKLSAVECESGNVEMQWTSIKKDTMSDLVGKVEGEQESHGLHRT
jgi:hypothetical protein